ncbi:response regulator [Clostridium ganghwense]|uniref:Transcriptional regulatory protein n=1 Tax=Clostridium ganghwense TaxID=312089 RepID=A0ABT4CW86_9CLOT|nr:response regulator [Clostridium ganghwense]MCY6372673.1 response regulator [Clostridium ganghwense]
MIKVLIVEDDPMVKEINEKFLNKVEGYVLHNSVNTIDKAKKVILASRPDLILLDVFFPQGRGLDLLKWIRIKNIKCDVILITADKSMETVEEAFRYGVVDYLVKPFAFKRFKEALLKYRNRKDEFKNIDNVEQEIIDKITLNDKNTPLNDDDNMDIKDIKGFSQHTYEKIIECIKNVEGKNITAQEVSSIVGVSRITARRYLDYLEKQGKVILEMEYGKVGRPLNKYKLKED